MKKILDKMKRSGYVRVRVDGSIYDLTEEEINLDKNKKHDIEVVVDRIIVKEGVEGRLTDSVEGSFKTCRGYSNYKYNRWRRYNFQ